MAGTDPEGVESRRRSRLPALLGVLAVSLALLAGVTYTLPYYAVAPGSVVEVGGLFGVPEDRSFPPTTGSISLATVDLRSLTAFEALRGWLDPDVDVVPAPRVLGAPLSEEAEERFAEQGTLSMGQSQDLAVLAALGQLGLLAEQGDGARVGAVAEGSPAEGHLRPGDVVIAADGRPTPRAGDLVAAVAAGAPGQTLRLEVAGAGGAVRSEDVVLGPAPEGTGAWLGVSLGTETGQVDLPFEVEVDAVAAGGPSAGLALTLGLIDLLSPGELTGGHRVAATGTIDAGGTVGEVDGTAQKAAASRAAGMEYLLVPPGGADAAAASAGDSLEVVPVSTLDEALAALGRIGGDVEALRVGVGAGG